MAWFDNPTDLAAVDEIFKEILYPEIIDQINREVSIYSIMRRQSPELVGKKWELANEVGHNEGIGFVVENRDLPIPNPQEFARVELFPKALYGRMFITGHAMEQTGSSYGSLADALMVEMRGLVRDFKFEFGRIFWGNGRGVLANSVVAAGNSVVPGPAGNLDVTMSWGINSLDPRPTRLFRPGMHIASIDLGPPAAIEGLGFVNRIVDANTIEVTCLVGQLGGAAAHQSSLVRANTDAAPMDIRDTGYGELGTGAGWEDNIRESYGLQNVANDNEYMNVDGAVDTWWSAFQGDMAGGTVDESHVREGLDEVQIASGEEPGTFFTSHVIRRKIADALVADRRYVNTMRYEGGWSAIELHGKPIFVDRHMPIDMFFGLSLGEIAVCQTRDPFWIENDGAVLCRRENQHAFQAVMAYFHNMRAFTRNTHFRYYNCDCT